MKTKFKVGDLVQCSYRFRTITLQRKGYIVAIREDLEDPEGRRDLVYDIQWFGRDQLDRLTDTWFKPLRKEVEQSGE